MRSTPDIYALPVSDNWMLVSPHSSTTAMVNRAGVEALAAYAEDDGADVPMPLIDLWCKLCEPSATALPAPAEPEKLVIIPTRACNMQCVYCDFGRPGASAQTLDPGLACKLIDATVARLTSMSHAMLRIHFFGGEPLSARRCIETVVHYARMVCARKALTPWFEITTNGLFDSTAIPFIGDYIDNVVVSLDGPEAFHDFTRRRKSGAGTYAAIAANIRQLSRFPVELSVRTCITNRSVEAIADIASHLCSEFEFDVLCFEMLAPNEESHDAGLSPPDPDRFAAGVLEAEALAAAHGVRVVHSQSELTSPRTTSCPVGRGTLMLNPDGRLTACYLETERWTERGIDPVLGRVDPVSGPMIEPEKSATILQLVQSKPRCARCFCRHTCAGGCHIEQTPPGCSLEYDDRCRATRIITAGRMLRNLEGAAAADAFAGQSSVMRRVAENPDDRLTAWSAEPKRAHP